MPHPELFFGIVGATGTDLNEIRVCLQTELSLLGITLHKIRLSDLLLQWQNKSIDPRLERTKECMDAGDLMRQKVALAGVTLLGIQKVRQLRQTTHDASGLKVSAPKKRPVPDNAYFFHSLKHPGEVKMLRQIYGQSFYLISVYADEEGRRKRTLAAATESDSDLKPLDAKPKIEALFERDNAASEDYGQHVQKVFPHADLFLNGDDSKDFERTIKRFVRLIFGDRLITPTKEEFFMFQAHAAARRSGDLGRQVGACIATQSGILVTVGCNEVPRAGGGQYWCEDTDDHRDCINQEDANEQRQRELLCDLLSRLQKGGKLAIPADQIQAFVDLSFSSSDGKHDEDEATKQNRAVLKGADLFNVIGYYRAVHAETAALLEAARTGSSVQDCHLFVTAFPCHECARHLVCAGISKVYYIEPYPKSLASIHYPDSIEFAYTEKPNEQHLQRHAQGHQATKFDTNEKVLFRPFTGISPRLYFELFMAEKGSRKLSDGTVNVWAPERAALRNSEQITVYIQKETDNLERFKKRLDKLKEDMRNGEKSTTPK